MGKRLQEFLAYPVQSSLAYQMYGAEEVFSGRDSLGEFEQDHVSPHLRCQSSKPARTPSLERKRGGSVDKMSANERGVRRRAATTSSTSLMNDLTLQATAGSGCQMGEGPSSLLSLCARESAFLKEKEEFLRSTFLFLQDDIYPATDKLRRYEGIGRHHSKRSTATAVKNTATLCGSVLSVLNPPARGDRTNCFKCCGCWGHHQFNYAVHGISGPRETEPRGGTPGQARVPCGQHEGTLSRPPSRQNLGTAR